MNYEGDDD